jgi:hypothetical protein
MTWDLESAGPIRELAEGERGVARAPTLKRLRDSHHAVARLLAHGLTPFQVSLQTGYSPSRISTLQVDPAFQELREFYRRNADAVAQEFEAKMQLVAQDAAQRIHEMVQDDEIESPALLNEIFKTFADRAGFAPVQRSVNKNMNLNIGERLDAARRRKDEAA